MINLNNAVFITLGVPMLLYVMQSVQFALQQGRYGMALAMFAYGMANIGLIMDSKGI